ncbi:MAG: acyltransferase [Hyphomicrobiaceae bacterium]
MQSKEPFLRDVLDASRNNFGAIRLAMALAVLVSHSYWLTTGQVALEPLHNLTGYTLGEHAVQVFFFLSGVVVTQSLMKSGSLLDFTLARALRIFPALVVCVLLTAFVLGPAISTLAPAAYFSDTGVFAYVVRTLTLSTGSAPLPGVFAETPVPNLVNLSLWTLKYEVACYILLGVFGMVYLRFERLRSPLTVGLAVAVVAAFAGWTQPNEPFGFSDSLRYFVVFFGAGTLAYLMRDWLLLTWRALPPLFALFVLSIGTDFVQLASALFLGYATLVVAAIPVGRLRSFTNVQDFSYGVYILHCPIQQALVDRVDGMGSLELAIVSTLIVVPLSIASWNLIEYPAIRARRSIVGLLRNDRLRDDADRLTERISVMVH